MDIFEGLNINERSEGFRGFFEKFISLPDKEMANEYMKIYAAASDSLSKLNNFESISDSEKLLVEKYSLASQLIDRKLAAEGR